MELMKDQELDLSHRSTDLSKIMIGFGWEAVKREEFLGCARKEKILWDPYVAAICLGIDDKVLDTVFFNSTELFDGSLQYKDDYLDADPDYAFFLIDLNALPHEICKLAFSINIWGAFEKNEHFGLFRNVYIRVVDCNSQQEIGRFLLNENYNNMTTLIAGMLIRTTSGWKFKADGRSSRLESLVDVIRTFE